MSTSLNTVLSLSRARSQVVRELDADLGAFHGLSLSDLALLLELRSAPEHKLRRVDLANHLGVTPSGVARQLAPLERMGLVGRESHARDARLALVVLSDAGRRLADEALPSAEQIAERVLDSRWSQSEQHRLGRLLAAAV
jgi:DNA-binding MarR family transcriptional regulator